MKLGAARSQGCGGGWQAAPTTPGRASTVRWFGPGKQDGTVYVRNQRQNASQAQTTSSNLADLGWAAAHPHVLCGELLGRLMSLNEEATGKACGVPVAMLQGHSWAPRPSNGSRVNVGTIPAVPSPASSLLTGGKARRRLMPPGWGGGPVLVGGRAVGSAVPAGVLMHALGSAVFTVDSCHPSDLAAWLPPFAMWPAFPTSDYYGGSVPAPGQRPTTGLPTHRPGRPDGRAA